MVLTLSLYCLLVLRDVGPCLDDLDNLLGPLPLVLMVFLYMPWNFLHY